MNLATLPRYLPSVTHSARLGLRVMLSSCQRAFLPDHAGFGLTLFSEALNTESYTYIYTHTHAYAHAHAHIYIFHISTMYWQVVVEGVKTFK